MADRKTRLHHLRDSLIASERTGAGAPTVVESSLVLVSRLGPTGKTLLARFIREAGIDIVELTADHWTLAADAFVRYGKGRHRAALNFGDCLTYAVAKLAGAPLLCVGDDFPATDLLLAGRPYRHDHRHRPAHSDLPCPYRISSDPWRR